MQQAYLDFAGMAVLNWFALCSVALGIWGRARG